MGEPLRIDSSSTDPTRVYSRYPFLDFLRGHAVVMMAIFHLAYDLTYFKFVAIDFTADPFWYPFARFIVFVFFICIGMGATLSNRTGIAWPNVYRRALKIGGWALCISLVTYFALPGRWVFFGTLHCIAVSALITPFFVPYPKLSLGLSILIVVPNLIFQPTWFDWKKILGVTPVDYVPLYPWFGIILLGIYLGSIGFHKVSIPINSFSKPFIYCGKHALLIYLIHQPILFTLTYLATLLAP